MYSEILSGVSRTFAAAAICATLTGFAGGAPAQDFETPPDEPPAALLPAAYVAGENFHLADPVRGDGLMHQFVLESRFGRFDAYGTTALKFRVNEIAALTQLAKTSDVEVVAAGVGRGITSQIDTATAVIAHPIKTVTGIPKGIGHLFHGYRDEGKEALDSANRAAKPANGGTTRTSADAGRDTAKRYAARYLGVTAAERRWYQQLGVDPYTDNAVLRDAIHRKAKVEAAAGVGMRFVGLPGIPEIGEIRRAMDAIYKDDPATIRARDRATLSGYGLDAGEIERWQNALVLSPTRQALLMEAAKDLTGVSGRAELFRHAQGLTSDVEAQVYVESARLLVRAHRHEPVAAMLPGVRLPAAQMADGRVIVCGAFDAVYWTQEVADREYELEHSLPASAGPVHVLWLAGRASDRARAELQRRGWDVHDSIESPEETESAR